MGEYKNATEETLVARIPRLSLAPGEVIELNQGEISYTVRMWIRSGALEPVEGEKAPAAAKKTAAKKPAAKKPVAKT